jgi:hypothetical protein
MVLLHYTAEEAAWMNSGMNDSDSQPQDKLPNAITIGYLILNISRMKD